MESLTCQICCVKYNNQANIPWILSCGHTFCAVCISGFHKECPNCRKKFEPSRTQRNYALCSLVEEFASYFNTNSPTPSQAADICKYHYEKLNQFCKKCIKSMCVLCQCPHLRDKQEKDVLKENELKDEVEKIMKGYVDLNQKKQVIKKQIDKTAEKTIEAIESYTQLLIKEVKNSAEQLKEDLCSLKDLSEEKRGTFEDSVTLFKKAKEEQDVLNHFLQKEFVIELQSENHSCLTNAGKFESKQIFKFLQKSVPIISISFSNEEANKENICVNQNRKKNEEGKDVVEISQDEWKKSKKEEEVKEEEPPKLNAWDQKSFPSLKSPNFCAFFQL